MRKITKVYLIILILLLIVTFSMYILASIKNSSCEKLPLPSTGPTEERVRCFHTAYQYDSFKPIMLTFSIIFIIAGGIFILMTLTKIFEINKWKLFLSFILFLFTPAVIPATRIDLMAILLFKLARAGILFGDRLTPIEWQLILILFFINFLISYVLVSLAIYTYKKIKRKKTEVQQ